MNDQIISSMMILGLVFVCLFLIIFIVDVFAENPEDVDKIVRRAIRLSTMVTCVLSVAYAFFLGLSLIVGVYIV